MFLITGSAHTLSYTQGEELDKALYRYSPVQYIHEPYKDSLYLQDGVIFCKSVVPSNGKVSYCVIIFLLRCQRQNSHEIRCFYLTLNVRRNRNIVVY